jgi:phosphoribosyl 1,2-cyclic phosphodiesterase
LGFKFGGVAYISDVSEIPEETRKLIKGCDLLILDAVDPYGCHPSHFTLPDALAEIPKIQPKRTLLIGMTHLFDHESTNVSLAHMKKKGIDVQLSYDGMCIPLNL